MVLSLGKAIWWIPTWCVKANSNTPMDMSKVSQQVIPTWITWMDSNLQIIEGSDPLWIAHFIYDYFACSIKMIRKILQNEVRKDLRRANNHHNHREYLRALNPLGKLNYLARYHKKKIIFSILVSGISWTYDWHLSMY